VHIREVHIQERKHICLRCNRGFFKKAYLKKHSCGSTRKSGDDQTLKKIELDSEKERSDSTQLVLVPNQKLSDPAPITKLSTPESRIQTPESRMQTSESRIQTSESRIQTSESRIQTSETRIQTPESLKEKHENPDKNFTSSLHSRENHRYEINFLCFKCKRGFLKISHLKKHFKTCRIENKMSVKTLTKKLKKMEKDQTRVYECQSCNKTFGNKKKLNRHKKEVHIGEVKYGCSSCDKKFARMEHLKRHLKSNNLMCLSPSEEVINYSGVRFMRSRLMGSYG
jgi:hypothetical protein